MNVLKKMLFAILMSVLLTLTACSPSNDSNKEEKQAVKKTEETGGALEVDKGLLAVEVTISATFMEGEDIDNVVAEAKKDGIKDVTKNEDGSVTYKMSKAEHKGIAAAIGAISAILTGVGFLKLNKLLGLRTK